MLDQAAAPTVVDPPATPTKRAPGPALDTGVGGRVIPLDTRRRRPSPDAVAASRACHPSRVWAQLPARDATAG